MIMLILASRFCLAATVDASPRVIQSETGGDIGLAGRGLAPGTRVVMIRHGGDEPGEVSQIAYADGEGGIRFSVPAWQVPGRYEVRVEPPGEAPRCIAGGIEIVAEPCALRSVVFEGEGGALSPDAYDALRDGTRCLAANGAEGVVAFGLSAPGEGLGLLREARADGRSMSLGYRPDLAVDRAALGAEQVASMLPPGTGVHAVGLARPLPPREAHDSEEWTTGSRVDLMGAWTVGLGPSGCPISVGAPDDAALACFVNTSLRAVVVAAPDRVRSLGDAGKDEADEEELTGVLTRLKEAGIPVVVGARPAGAKGILVIPVPIDSLGPPRHFPVEGCAGSAPLARRPMYGRGDEPGWAWAVAAGSGLSTDAGADGTLAAVAGGLVRVGVAGGPFVGAEISASVKGDQPVGLAPVVGVELALLRDAVPTSAWLSGHGIVSGAPSLGLGADIPVFAGFARRLVLAIGPRAVVGLGADSAWSLGFGARLGWRQRHPWGRDDS